MTNVRRAKFDNQVSDMCVFCNENSETIFHLIWKCDHVQKLWTALSKWLKRILKGDMELTPKAILLNNLKIKNHKLVNTCILIMKRYIYVTKCLENKLNFIDYLIMLDKMYNIEKLTAFNSRKTNVFVKKWNPYINYCG